CTSAAVWTFGSINSSSRSPAPSTIVITSRYVHSVSHALTRTHNTVSPQSSSLIAWTILSRAPSFSSGATASSRSRNTMSAARPGALPSIFSLEPGTDRQERRGRLRERSDMRARLKVVSRWLQPCHAAAVEAAALADAIGCTLVRRLGGGEGESADEVRTADDTRAALKLTRRAH